MRPSAVWEELKGNLPETLKLVGRANIDYRECYFRSPEEESEENLSFLERYGEADICTEQEMQRQLDLGY